MRSLGRCYARCCGWWYAGGEAPGPRAADIRTRSPPTTSHRHEWRTRSRRSVILSEPERPAVGVCGRQMRNVCGTAACSDSLLHCPRRPTATALAPLTAAYPEPHASRAASPCSTGAAASHLHCQPAPPTPDASAALCLCGRLVAPNSSAAQHRPRCLPDAEHSKVRFTTEHGPWQHDQYGIVPCG